MKTLGTILLTLFSLSTFGQRDLVGYYLSNVADNGIFITKIHLKPDSTFKYEFYGDLLYDRGTGKYKVENRRTIWVTFDRDSIDIRGLGRMTNRPVKFLFKRGRLYEFKTNGKPLRRGRAYGRHKKYLFFGDYYMTNRKMYLKRREGNLIWRGEENASR
ncbi:MAG: hypothetical protein ABIS36_09725 [Chryseolinea sp.]